MVLLLDNFDSFTYNLVDYLSQLGVGVKVFRNDVDMRTITSEEYSGVVISPGPETPEKAGNLLSILSHYIGKVPILGICLGHQAIGQHFGAELVKAEKPMHGKISKIQIWNEGRIFNGLPEKFNVVRYNSLIIKNLPEELVCLASTESGEIMALRHSSVPLWGLQFHPEAALTQYGLTILKNWLTSNHIIT